jgi:hypothetical protein
MSLLSFVTNQAAGRLLEGGAETEEQDTDES